MDTQNRQYHLIYGERDWLPLLLKQDTALVWWDRDRQSVSLAPVVQQLSELDQDQYLQTDQRRGAAFDHYGNVYWIDNSRLSICYQPAVTKTEKGEFWHVRELQLAAQNNKQHGDFESAEIVPVLDLPLLSGLTVTTSEYLVVGTLASTTHNAGLLIFDLHSGGAPTWVCWPSAIEFFPLDFSCAPDGGVFILDRDCCQFITNTYSARVWHLDKNFRVLDCNGESIDLSVQHDFVDQDESVEEINKSKRFLSGIPLNTGSPHLISSPVSIEAVADNAFLVLNTEKGDSISSVHYFRDGNWIDAVDLNADTIGNLLSVSEISAHDFTFLPGVKSDKRIHQGSLYVSANNIAQAFEFAMRASGDELQLALQPKLLPMRAQTGRALIRSGVCPYYDFDDRWLPLTEQPRHQFQSQAELGGIVLDGDEPDCVWHRLIVDACIPPGTAIGFDSRASDSLAELAILPWQAEPALYLRAEGSELPQLNTSYAFSSEHAGSYELLFQNAVGRYIELRLRLNGTKRATPMIRACRVYYPRFSYLKRYLPAVYQDDEKSASFLDRFLANIEGIFTQIENKVSHAESLFDTRTTPPEMLDWLGQWLGAFANPHWDDKRRRLFIDNATLLFQWRGTLAGILALVRLSIDECPDDSIFEPLRLPLTNSSSFIGERDVRIVERFLTRRLAQTDTEIANTKLELTSSRQSWQPIFGAGALHNFYQSYLRFRYQDDIGALNSAWELKNISGYKAFTEILFPPLTPLQSVHLNDWQDFTRDHIGFTYPLVSLQDEPFYREFIQLRYQQVEKLNAAHGLVGALAFDNFNEIELPVQLPQNQKTLTDWIEFVSLALPIHQQAHQFTVFLPTKLGELPDEMERRRAQVTEIVSREKPAHTQFDVQFFWAMFQVGSARLGIDTSVGEGGRFVALVLGSNFLGQSFLSESHPWSVFDRSVVGRERLTYDLKWRS